MGETTLPFILAMDSDEVGEKVFKWYLNHLHRHGNSIVILHCIDLSHITVGEDHTKAGIAENWKKEKAKIKKLEDKYRWKLNENYIPGKIRTEEGKPGDVIIKVAKEEKARLIVIGSRGLSKLKRTFTTSVSDHVLHHASCPVVICRQIDDSEGDDVSRRGSTSSSASSVMGRTDSKRDPQQPVPTITIDSSE